MKVQWAFRCKSNEDPHISSEILRLVIELFSGDTGNTRGKAIWIRRVITITILQQYPLPSKTKEKDWDQILKTIVGITITGVLNNWIILWREKHQWLMQVCLRYPRRLRAELEEIHNTSENWTWNSSDNLIACLHFNSEKLLFRNEHPGDLNLHWDVEEVVHKNKGSWEKLNTIWLPQSECFYEMPMTTIL